MTRLLAENIAKDDDGGALVEFGMLLPILLVFLALTFEGGRTFWSYQTTTSGVRDAARYLSRVVQPDVCTTGGSTAAWDETLANIVRTGTGDAPLFPEAVAINSVTSTLNCASGAYRSGTAPVAMVTAELEIGYPFAGMFSMAGITLGTITTIVSDSARVVGT